MLKIIFIIGCIILLLVMWYIVSNYYDKRTQKKLYEDIEREILMSESEDDLNSNSLFNSMQVFKRDWMYNKEGEEYWVKMNKHWNDAEKYFIKRRESDCVRLN